MSAPRDRDEAPRRSALVFYDASTATVDAAVRWAGVAFVVTLIVLALSVLG